MRKRSSLVLLLLGFPLLSGCGSEVRASSETESRPSVTSTAMPGASSEPRRELSTRNKLQLKVEDTAILRSKSGDEVLRFQIHSMREIPVSECPNPLANPPENGHFVALEISFEASPRYDSLQNDLQPDNPGRWRMIDSDGLTVPKELLSAPALFCFNGDGELPSVAPGEQGRGLVMLDLPSTSGVLIHEDQYTGTGWEWSIDTK